GAGGRIVGGEQARIEGQLAAVGRGGVEGKLVPAGEALGRFEGGRRGDIDLRGRLAGTLANIAAVEVDLDAVAVKPGLQAAELEPGVAEAEAKRKQGRGLFE